MEPERSKRKRRERDRDLGRPTRAVAAGGHRPHAVPLGVDLLPLVGDQRVGARAVGVELERVAVAAIGEGVENEGDRVVVLPHRRVALHLLGDDRVGLRVERADAEVERGRGVEHRELGRFAGGKMIVRLARREVAADLGALPDRLFEHAVEDDRGVDRERRDRWARSLFRLGAAPASPRARQEEPRRGQEEAAPRNWPVGQQARILAGRGVARKYGPCWRRRLQHCTSSSRARLPWSTTSSARGSLSFDSASLFPARFSASWSIYILLVGLPIAAGVRRVWSRL